MKEVKSDLTAEQLKSLKAHIAEGLAQNRHELLIKFPFVGNLLMRMGLIPIRDLRCRTACTDGNDIYFDCEFYETLTKDERLFVLAHELFHCVMLHLVRCQSRDEELFNIATDMEVNYMLSQQKQGIAFKAPENLCFPPKSMAGKSAEVIYEWLLRNRKTPLMSSGNLNGKSSSGGGNGEPEDSSDDGNDSTNATTFSKRGSGATGNSCKNTSSSKGENSAGKLSGQFDKHQYNDDADIQESDGSFSVSDRWGQVGLDNDFNPTVADDFSEKMREAVISEVQRTQRTQGLMPAGMDGILEQLLKPEIHWKEELAKFVTTCYNGNRRWLPPSRRHVYNELYLQSRRSERLNIAVCVDTSGSCLDDLPKFFGELKGLLDSFGSYDLHLMNCDAQVDYYEHFDDSNPLSINKASDIKYSGGGGTSFKPPFKYVREHNINVDCLVYFTDGYGDAPTYAPPYPVLWVLTKDGSRDFCEWGKKIFFKNETPYTNLPS